jgi:hypothetical protein
MTPAQQQYLALFEHGYGVCEISRMTGKNKSTVSRELRRARRSSDCAVCPHSPSCFDCPCDDCISSDPDVNQLDFDKETR